LKRKKLPAMEADKLLETIEQVHDFLAALDIRKAFSSDLSEQEAAKLLVHKNPISLPMILNRAQEGLYTSIEDLDVDVRKMCDNHLRFLSKLQNPAISTIEQHREITKQFLEVWKLAYRSIQNGYGSLVMRGTASDRKRAKISGGSSMSASTKVNSGTPVAVPAHRPPKAISSTPSTKMLQEEFLNAHKWITNLDTDKIFAHPVSDENAPGYSREIKRPMDLTKMMTRIQAGKYNHLDDFDDDAVLMFTNCVFFNGHNTVYGAFSHQLFEKWCQHVVAIEKRLYGPLAKRNRLDSQIDYIFRDAHHYMCNLDDGGVFAYPVTEHVAPNYFSKIPRHKARDLYTIGNKIRRRLYANFHDLSMDIMLMLNNCIQFNGTESPLGKVANGYREAWLAKSQEFGRQEHERLTELGKEGEFRAPPKPTGSMNKPKPQDNTLGALIKEGWEFMKGLDKGGAFAEPVKIPGYRQVISEEDATDLKTIRRKVDRNNFKSKSYVNLDSFDAEIKRMLDNCIKYWSPENPLGQVYIYLLSSFTILEPILRGIYSSHLSFSLHSAFT
jgi:hypothetical protein